MRTGRSSPLPDLERFANEIQGDLLIRWHKKAQRSALLEWRDRTAAPGLAARFQAANRQFYGFAMRKRKSAGPFVRTGGFKAMIAARAVRSKVQGNEVVSRIKYGGGPLYFLMNKHGWTNLSRSVSMVAVPVAAYSYTKSKTGSTVNVPATTAMRRFIAWNYTYSTRSYAAEFGDISRDQPWIEQRTKALLVAIWRTAAIDRRTGKLKDRVRLHPQAGAA